MAEIQVSPESGVRIQMLREGRQWSIADAAQRVGIAEAVWEAFETGRTVPADAYRTILEVFGFTEHTMAFIDRAVQNRAPEQEKAFGWN